MTITVDEIDIHEPLWSKHDVAEFLGLSVRTIESPRFMDQGPTRYLISGSYRWVPAEVRAYVAGQASKLAPSKPHLRRAAVK